MISYESGYQGLGTYPQGGENISLPYKPIVRGSDVALISLFLSYITLARLYPIQLPPSCELLREVVSTDSKLQEDLKITPCSLARWLHKTYFDDEKIIYFTEAEIQAAKHLVQPMMQYRPSNPPLASQLLHHRCFRIRRSETQEVQKFPRLLALEGFCSSLYRQDDSLLINSQPR